MVELIEDGIQNEIQNNILAIRQDIERAAMTAGRRAADVTLVAVSKTQSEARIDAALLAGLRVFGENRVQEAQKRWARRRADMPDLQLHLIGPLQSNKAGEAVALFDVIQTVDREKIARALAAEMAAQGRVLPCYVQVNSGAEPQKAGVLPQDAADFVTFCRDECGLVIDGLMCIPPVDDDPAVHFEELRALAARAGVAGLSMGMSADYQSAIACGATMVRVGSALFGGRG